MPLYKTARNILDRQDALEIILELDSFAGGENILGTDQELKKNEARIIKNWDISSLGGMMRVKGFTKVITGSPTYTAKIDLAVQHSESTTNYSFYISGGNLLKKNAAAFALDHASDAASFTSGILSRAVSSNDALWITNSTDNLKRKVIGAAVAAPAGVPATASERIYEHPTSRLIAEGGHKTVYGSRAGSGNWIAANAWSASNDAWSIAFPENTQGAVMGFPSGLDITVFTKFDTYVIYNQPNVARRKILNGHGCVAPDSIAKGDEGIFFLSRHPTFGIFLWDGTQFVNITEKHDFINNVNLSARIFGIYKNNRYYFIYNETGSGVTYPNRVRIYDARFGRWWQRSINSSVGDALGYPCLLTKDNNEIYIGSSQVASVYEFEDSSTSDNGYNTEATYESKVFSSDDFMTGGSPFPIDYVRLKLIKFVIEYKGTSGSISILWSADRGKYSGSQSFNITTDGDLINSTFIVNSSEVSSTPPARLSAKSFKNSAVGREFSFQLLNSAITAIPEIRKIRIYAVALEDF